MLRFALIGGAAVLVLIFWHSHCVAQRLPEMSMRDVFGRIDTALARGNILTALDELRALEQQYAGDRRSKSYDAISTSLLTLYSKVGRYEEALRLADLGRRNSAARVAAAIPVDYRAMSAVTAMAHLAANAKIVMINEAHHVPQHRVFATELLITLRALGFNTLAAETLSEWDTQLQGRGYPVRESGYYSSEPAYGHLIRTALRLGYRVLPYEGSGFTNAEERESMQARNIIGRVFAKEPTARLIVYCGYSHIDEVGTIGGAKTLAQRLRSATGVDPLTIDQVSMTERGSRSVEDPIYRQVDSQGLIDGPTIFVNAQRQPWSSKRDAYDVTVFHPRSRYINGRPDWLINSGQRRLFTLERRVCGAHPRCLVAARYENESPHAVPIDQLEVARENPAATPLLLPEGRFVIDVSTPAGELIHTFVVESGNDADRSLAAQSPLP